MKALDTEQQLNQPRPYVCIRQDTREEVILSMSFREWQEKSFPMNGGWYIELPDGGIAKHDAEKSVKLMSRKVGLTTPGDYNHVSGSLAINPEQITAHKKLFPDVDVLPDGRLHFRSVKSQERYCDKTGFHKVPQKLKRRGVRIA